MTNFFTNQLQNKKKQQYVLLKGLVSDYETSSDESSLKTDEYELSIHTYFWECYDEVVAEHFTDDTNEIRIDSTLISTSYSFKQCVFGGVLQ